MKTLWLLRHAKSSWANSSQSDYERPLNARGRDAATRIGRHLARRGVLPALALCSSAQRTCETLENLSLALGQELDTHIERGLYLASADGILARLEAVSDAVDSVLVVAHNPGIAELALRLAQHGPDEPRRRLERKFPTAALAELRLDAASWRELARGCELASFVVPRELAG